MPERRFSTSRRLAASIVPTVRQSATENVTMWTVDGVNSIRSTLGDGKRQQMDTRARCARDEAAQRML